MRQYPTIEFEFINEVALPKDPITSKKIISCYAIGAFQNMVQPGFDSLIDLQYYQDIITPLVSEYKFTGNVNSSVGAHCFQYINKIILIGLGEKEKVNPEIIRQAASLLYREATKLKATDIVVHFPTILNNNLWLQAFAEGILLTAHQDNRFKSKKDETVTQLSRIQLLNVNEDKHTMEVAKKIVAGVICARELVNAPANYVTPSSLAETAKKLAKKYNLECKILDKEACSALGMGAYLGVSQGSDMSPYFIHLCYRPKFCDTTVPFSKVALIGKGLTFDCGGLNLKVGNAAAIELMKFDMSGAAAILGTADVIGALQPNKEIHFIVAATENMINGNAMHPGDIVTASNGKTIEVDNVDAEGRLTLADALVYAEKLGVDVIIDLATLTGAIVMALGNRIAGLFTENQLLANSLIESSQDTGEKLWRMPMEEGYCKKIRSSVADMKNAGEDKMGGAITAALFLKQFVEKTPWSHIDIAGVVWNKNQDAYNNEGATGYGVRLLVNWLVKQ